MDVRDYIHGLLEGQVLDPQELGYYRACIVGISLIERRFECEAFEIEALQGQDIGECTIFMVTDELAICHDSHACLICCDGEAESASCDWNRGSLVGIDLANYLQMIRLSTSLSNLDR